MKFMDFFNGLVNVRSQAADVMENRLSCSRCALPCPETGDKRRILSLSVDKSDITGNHHKKQI